MNQDSYDREFYLRHTCSLPSSLLLKEPDTFYFAKDRQGIFVCASARFLDHLGRHAGEVIGRSDYEVFRRDLADRYREDDLQVMKSGETFQDRLEIVPAKDRLQWFSTVKGPLRNLDGQIIGIEGLTRDAHLTHSKLTRYHEFSRCMEHIRNRIAESHCIPQLAAMCGMSLSSFERKFKKHFGCTPKVYIRNLRLERACELLQAGRSIGETAELCGFCDQSYFTLEFRRSLGVSPRLWRERNPPRQ
ncbi:MAG: hypothetical protein RL095_1247 [Verrucomicrobiota bacterium]|jgi:PAS domain S-box-containing protein